MKKEDVTKEGLIKLAVAIIKDKSTNHCLYLYYDKKETFGSNNEYTVTNNTGQSFCKKQTYISGIVYPECGYRISSGSVYDVNTMKEVFTKEEILGEIEPVMKTEYRPSISIFKEKMLPINISANFSYKEDFENIERTTNKVNFWGTATKFTFKITHRTETISKSISYNGFSFDLTDEEHDLICTAAKTEFDAKKEEIEDVKRKKELKILEIEMKKFKVL